MLWNALNFVFELSLVNLLLIKFILLDGLLLSVRARRHKEEQTAHRREQEAERQAERERRARDRDWAAERTAMSPAGAD